MKIVLDLRLRQLFAPEQPLFAVGAPPTTRQVATLAQATAWVLQEQSLFEGTGSSPKVGFFSCGGRPNVRAGANIPLPTIQVIGRWGSNAIMRYVQSAVFVPEQAARVVQAALQGLDGPSCVASSASSSSSPGVTAGGVRSIVRRALAELWQNQAMFVRNPRSKFVHKPSPMENTLSSERWTSFCGKWRYGQSNCLRQSTVLDGFKKCAKCFSDDPAAVAAGEGEDNSECTSSSSS